MDHQGLRRRHLPPHLVPDAGWAGGAPPPDHLGREARGLAGACRVTALLTSVPVGVRGGGCRAPPASLADPERGVQEKPVAQNRLTNLAVVRLRKAGQRLEIACLPNKVLFWRTSVEKDLDEVLQSHTVYSNVFKCVLIKAFSTDDLTQICLEILEKGELQVSGKEREAQLSSRFRDIATIIMDKTINSETRRPYTLNMVERLMHEIHFAVDPNLTSKEQAVVRVRFPDSYILEAEFHPSETVYSLVDLLMKVIARPDLPFYLYTVPPKKRILDTSQDFYTIGFVPGANVFFSYDLPEAHQSDAFRPDSAPPPANKKSSKPKWFKR